MRHPSQRGDRAAHSQPPDSSSRSAYGFTLVEVMTATTMCVFLLLALHTGSAIAIKTRTTIKTQSHVAAQADELLDRIRSLPFGASTDGAATPKQLTEFFDADDDLGTITLLQLVVAAKARGHSFRVVSRGFAGEWTVHVSKDLNGDGDTKDARENRDDLLRIELRFDDRMILEALRASPASTSTVDLDNDYMADVPSSDPGLIVVE